MTRTLSPFPIFPTMSTFVRCINDGLDFPANIHVLERLSRVDESCLPVEMCRHAADFILESMRIKRTPWPGRYSDYSAVLQMALNWSFLVIRLPSLPRLDRFGSWRWNIEAFYALLDRDQ